MSSGAGSGIGGGAAPRGGGARKHSTKKFGKNLNALTKAPAAPPVANLPSAGGTSSFSGSASSRNGLLLLSTKSKTSSSTASAAPLTPAHPLGQQPTAHDKLLYRAGAGGGGEGTAGKPAVAAWGTGEAKNAPASPEKKPEPGPALGGDPGRAERPGRFSSSEGRYSSQQHRPYEGGRYERRGDYDRGYDRGYDRPRDHDRPRDYDRPSFGGRSWNDNSDRYERREYGRDYDRPSYSVQQERRPVEGRFSAREAMERERFSREAEGARVPERFSREPVEGGRVSERFSKDPEPLERGRFEKDVSEKMEGMGLNKAEPSENATPGSPKSAALEPPQSDVPEMGEAEKPSVSVAPPQEKASTEATLQPPKEGAPVDEQMEYMKKLAKERAEKRRAEEEVRMAAQKERAAMRLRELEEKRLEEKRKKRAEEKASAPVENRWQKIEETEEERQMKAQERKEIAKPHVLLQPLGKSTKVEGDSSVPKAAARAQTGETRNGSGRTLYDPNRTFSSLVGGKAAQTAVDHKLPEQRATKSPTQGPAPTPAGRFEADARKKDESAHVHMVELDRLDELDRGAGQGGPRMLYDPTSGSMVAVSAKDEAKPSKKGKQKEKKEKARRAVEETGENGSDAKLPRGKAKGGKGKDDAALDKKNKKALESKARPKPPRRKRFPRTCGVLYKSDKSGNYVNADGCEPDNGYGSHRVPGGKAKNTAAHARLFKQREDQSTALSQPAGAATDGFSFRNDPGFIQHQMEFEARQQQVLEDAWASLVENEGSEQAGAASKPGEDEYAAALAISPTMIGLNFDASEKMDPVVLPPSIQAAANTTDEPIDLAKFALEAASGGGAPQPVANPFSSLGVTGAGLWGAGTTAPTTSLGDLGALSGWDATPFGEADAAGSTGLNGSTSASKLSLWGSSALGGDIGLSGFGATQDATKETD